MEIITLNTWGGRAGREAFLDFFRSNAGADVFCLQEVWRAPYAHFEGSLAGGVVLNHTTILTDALSQVARVLPDHEYYFHPHVGENYGLATFVKKGIDILGSGEVFVHKHKDFVPEGDIGLHARNVQYLTLMHGDIPLTIMNFHGLWNGQGKTDTPDRLEQSARINEFIKTLTNSFILCGDFNLLPDTESVHMLERVGMRNLIREYGVTSTRSPLYTKKETYADYVFVSQGVQVDSFEVMSDVVSDHLALKTVISQR